MNDPGTQLLNLAKQVKNSVTIVAPFVKFGAFERLTAAIPSTIPIRLFTRWRPDEIAVGVSDPEVWEIIASRPASSLFLCHHLHAKCYIFDSKAFVGSANLTSRALGWHPFANLELLVQVTSDCEPVRSLIETLERVSILADEETALRFRKLAEEIRTEPEPHPMEPVLASLRVTGWLPKTRQPSQLFAVSSGKVDNVTRAARDTATDDLAYLGIPSGLSRCSFEDCVKTVISQLEFFRLVEELSTVPRRFGEYRGLVKEYLARHNIDRNAADTWQTCLRWLTHFQGDQYEVVTPRYSEILRRRS